MLGMKFKNILFILFGSAIFSFGLVHFNMENHLGEGGFTGITLLFYFVWGWDPAIMNIVLNVPVFFIGWKMLSRDTFYYTLIGTVAVSVFLGIFQKYTFHLGLESDLILATLFAGVFLGTGLGVIFRYGGTTGGVDIIARIINKHFGFSMGRIMFTFDFCVITLSLFTYLELVEGMYTLVVVYISARVIDFIQEGAYSARGATIISSKNDAIATLINKRMDRGVTILTGKGHYSGNPHNVLYCVVGKNEIVKLKTIIDEVDPHAFVAMTSVHEVMGEGFTLDDEKQPIK
ncbi:MAG TPA: YitT family protein [Pseudogracilibacillus sp.]|nr:YitT family protein [Pseudogracilibacillus sp.]